MVNKFIVIIILFFFFFDLGLKCVFFSSFPGLGGFIIFFSPLPIGSQLDNLVCKVSFLSLSFC